jgi:hypothetical protein
MAKRKETDEDIIKEMQERYEEAGRVWTNIHTDWKNHFAFAFAPGGQYGQQDFDRMGTNNLLQTNLLLAYVLQVVNKFVRQDIGCEVEPVSEGADKVLARVRQAQVMACWNRWGGPSSLATSMKNLVAGNFGVMSQKIDWANSEGFDKKIEFFCLKDPTKFRCDPNAKDAALADMEYCVIDENLTPAGFRKRYGEWKDLHGTEKDKWQTGDKRKVFEYWRIKKVNRRKVFMLEDGTPIPEKDFKLAEKMGDMLPIKLDENEEPVFRDVYDCKVEMFIITNNSVKLKKSWPGSRIPYKVFEGREVYIDGKKSLQPMTFAAEGPQKKYNFIENQKLTLLSKGPLEIVFVPADGDTQGLDEKLQEASRNGSKNLIVIPYKSRDAQGNLLPGPEFKKPVLGDPFLTEEALLTKKDIEQTFGMINPGWMERPKGASGIAIERTEEQGDTSSFDIIDNALMALQELFRDTMELLPKLSLSMQVKLAGEDQRQETVWVNGGQMNAASGMKNYDLDDDQQYSLMINARPEPDTMRRKSFEEMNEFAKRHPELSPMIADLDARASLNNLYSDDIADRANKFVATNFPNVLGDSGDPRLMMANQQIQQAQQMIQMLQTQMEQMAQEAGKKQAELEIKLTAAREDNTNDAARIQLEAQIEQEKLKQGWAKIQIDGMKAKAAEMKQVLSPSVAVARSANQGV